MKSRFVNTSENVNLWIDYCFNEVFLKCEIKKERLTQTKRRWKMEFIFLFANIDSLYSKTYWFNINNYFIVMIVSMTFNLHLMEINLVRLTIFGVEYSTLFSQTLLVF